MKFESYRGRLPILLTLFKFKLYRKKTNFDKLFHPKLQLFYKSMKTTFSTFSPIIKLIQET
jgi:hypothetical protein